MIMLYLALLNGVNGKRIHIIDEIFSQTSSKYQSEDMFYQENGVSNTEGKKPVLADDNARKFRDLGDKSWIAEKDGKQIKAGDSVAKIISGESETIAITELLHGNPWKTWRIGLTVDGSIILLKTSREVK